MRRNIFVGLGVLLALAAGILVWQGKERFTVVAPPAKPYADEPYAQSPHAAAIYAGLEYVRNHGFLDEPSWQVYAALDYLQRRFGLDERYALEQAYTSDLWRDHEQEIMLLMGRMTDPDHVIDAALLEDDEFYLVHVMVRAMYCDHYPVDAAFVDEVLARYDENVARSTPSYPETHIVLSFQWMRELGCDAPYPQIEARWNEFALVLAQMVKTAKAEADIAFEAMAFLYYIGRGDLVQDAWIEAMLSLQRPNGAWGYMPDAPDNGHPTVLAVWTLLEHALPEAERQPWLVK